LYFFKYIKLKIQKNEVKEVIFLYPEKTKKENFVVNKIMEGESLRSYLSKKIEDKKSKINEVIIDDIITDM
jgi:hypothetical protein